MSRFKFIFLSLLFAVPTVAYAQEGFTYDRVVGILFGLVDLLLTLGLVLAVIMIIWYAIQIMTSKNILKAKKGIFWAIVGAAVILGVNVLLATVANVVLELSG